MGISHRMQCNAMLCYFSDQRLRSNAALLLSDNPGNNADHAMQLSNHIVVNEPYAAHSSRLTTSPKALDAVAAVARMSTVLGNACWRSAQMDQHPTLGRSDRVYR